MTDWYVYLVRCKDGTLYCGVSLDPVARVERHNSGKASKYTRPRRPVTLVWVSEPTDKVSALKEEYRIKRLSRKEKLVLCGL